MRLRIKFNKLGRLKYIGHLDLLNIFNRAIKAAKLPVMYSKGFNPHMQIVFASPLSLGVTSTSEYADIDFDDSLNEETLIAALNGRLPHGLAVTEVYRQKEPYVRAPAVVTAASYKITGIENVDRQKVDGFMGQETIEVYKKTKKKTELTDIRQDILGIDIIDGKMSVLLSCGSGRNLKPSLFAETFCNYLGDLTPVYKLNIERGEIYAYDSKLLHGGVSSFLPLSKVNIYERF